MCKHGWDILPQDYPYKAFRFVNIMIYGFIVFNFRQLVAGALLVFMNLICDQNNTADKKLIKIL